jgi:small subunit ribosomal protein S9
MQDTETKNTYIETIGRRKTSSARVRITPASKTTFTINDLELDVHFPTKELQRVAREALTQAKVEQKFKITVIAKGGGISSQAGAVRHGIARALIKYDETLRSSLKEAGMLKRDSRSKERRKFGLKKARKAPQWSKR